MNQKVSIIEDDPVYQAILSKYVQEHEQLTLVSVDGTVLEGTLSISKKKPDILFLDIMLDGLDGFDLIEIIGDLKPKIIVISSDEANQEIAQQHGAVGFVSKPIHSHQELEDQVNKCFKLV